MSSFVSFPGKFFIFLPDLLIFSLTWSSMKCVWVFHICIAVKFSFQKQEQICKSALTGSLVIKSGGV